MYPAGPEPMMTTLAWVVFDIERPAAGLGDVALHNLGIPASYARHATPAVHQVGSPFSSGRGLHEIMLRAAAGPVMHEAASAPSTMRAPRRDRSRAHPPRRHRPQDPGRPAGPGPHDQCGV